MSPEVAAALWAVGGSLATLVATNIFNARQADKQMKFQIQEREIQNKQMLIHNSYEHRVEAYTKLFQSLHEFDAYLGKFIDHGNEFKKTLDPNIFNPLAQREKLMELFKKEALWLSKDANSAFMEFFILCDTGISLASSLPNDLISGGVEDYCIDLSVKIRKIKEIMKEDLGISYVDEFKDGKQKNKQSFQEVSTAKQ
ncbi:hypothetical protein COL23_13520 [Priestia aryabhattai]|uniref:hypothetical protein n=1 Tax=Priestia aryabhattai TaxID=412384 RepID=UPI000BFA2B45|nr:hypothetical protein [Priestia aryabhattai]PFW75845.1 hypothetical protein COL23_13520 [Priestia aryabhattai]